MKHPFRVFIVLLVAVLMVRPGNGCAGPESALIFTHKTGPDVEYSKYAAGHLGVVGDGYRIRHLVVAYDFLSGRGLSPAEQKAAVAVEHFYEPCSNTYCPETPSDDEKKSPNPLPWNPADTDRSVPNEDYDTFTNCLSDAFTSAAVTLADRRSRYNRPEGKDSVEVADWIAGQQAVFSNCTAKGRTPQPAPANAPLWLRQDRAYQTASAAFYALDFNVALTDFRAIANDHASPWAPLARYLVARTLIRQDTISFAIAADSPATTASDTKRRTGLENARDQLESILRDPAMKPLHSQSRHLLDYVMIRIDPAGQAEELARRLTETKPSLSSSSDGMDHDFYQNLIDLSTIYTSNGYTSDSVKELPPYKGHSQLIRWINDLYYDGPAEDEYSIGQNGVHVLFDKDADPATSRADILEGWRSTHSPLWLVAALIVAKPNQAENAALIAAAKDVPSTSPAWGSVTYHRLRLTVPVGAKEHYPESARSYYDELSALMPQIRQTQSVSTINQFVDLQSPLSPTFEDFLKNAIRQPASFGDTDGEEGDSFPQMDNYKLCGVKPYAPDTYHLNDDTAMIINQRLPLRLLRQAALSSALPANVRFQVAHMAWTRALLLGDVETARVLGPYLSGCQPAFKNWIDQWDAAKTDDERHVLGLLAMLRFTSTEPNARSGIEKDFAAYDGRDNWWCNIEDTDFVSDAQYVDKPRIFGTLLIPRTEQPDPPFLSDADRAEADAEIAKLRKIPSASDYFSQETLAWGKAHPDDPRNLELIGFTMRLVRNSCRTNSTPDLNQRLFSLLHRRFPNSDWARRYKTWE
jgi:hypothetical protein